MGICLSHITALEYLRHCNADDVRAWNPVLWNPQRGKPYRDVSPRDLMQLMAECDGIKAPAHIIVSHASQRVCNSYTKCHLLSSNLPHGALVQVKCGWYSASPALCFLQLAEELSIPKLAAIGYELCGGYRLIDGEVFKKGPALATTEVLRAFAENAQGIRGRRNALSALRYVIDNSASPRETAGSLMLCMSRRFGAYGFEQPLLNYEIKVDAYYRRATSWSSYKVDMYWPKAKLAIEYDSNFYHTKAEDIANDARRRNSLRMMGITVLTLTNQQLINCTVFDETARQVAKLLGTRVRTKDKSWYEANRELRHQIFLGEKR